MPPKNNPIHLNNGKLWLVVGPGHYRPVMGCASVDISFDSEHITNAESPYYTLEHMKTLSVSLEPFGITEKE